MNLTTTIEVLQHIAHIKGRESSEKTWALRIATQPNFNEQGQRESYRLAEQIGKVGDNGKRRSAFEVAEASGTRDDRIRMIGSAWSSAGERWSKGHKREVEWLAGQGVTLDEAAEMFNAWWNERVNDASAEYDSGAIGIGGVKTDLPKQPDQAEAVPLIDIDADLPAS